MPTNTLTSRWTAAATVFTHILCFLYSNIGGGLAESNSIPVKVPTVFKTVLLPEQLTLRLFLLLRDLYVSSWVSQLLHTNLRFSSLLSLLMPFIWSRISGIGLPFHSGPIPQQSHLYSMILSRINLFFKCDRPYVLFSTRTFSREYFSSQFGWRPWGIPWFHGIEPFCCPALGLLYPFS